MTTALIFAGIIAFLVGWDLFVLKLSGRPRWNPLWLAFTLTAAALLYGTTGLIGYSVPSDSPFITHRAIWLGHVVWPQVEMAAVLALLAVVPWWLGLKRL